MARVSKFARIAATAIAIAAAVPTGGTSLLAVGAASVGVGLSATAVAGIALASQIGASLLASKPKGSSGGSQTDWKADPRAPVPIVFGRTGVSGYIVYRKGSGNADRNTYQTLVTVLSGAGPIDAIEASYADKQKLTFSGTAETNKFKDWIWEDRQIGACPEASALQTGIGNKPGWTASSRLSGLAAVMNTLHYDSKGKGTFMTEPAMLWVIRGVRCYDPRQDSTYSGGSGPQRINDQTTWAYSNNPYVVGLTWALGWRQNGIRVAGVGMPVDTIDIAAFVEGANVADLNEWTVGGQVTTADDKWDVLKQILQAGGGEPIREGAILSCLVNAPRVSIATFGDADLAGAASIARTQRRRHRVNGIIPSYRSETHFWEQVPGALVQDANFVAQDGGERSSDITYPLVQVETGQQASQPIQLAGYDLENAREATPIVLPGRLRWIGFRPGDCITCGIGESGIQGRDLIILRRGLDPQTGVVPLTCRTEDPAKHARVFARTGDVPPATDFYRPDVPGEYAFENDNRAAHLIVRQSVAYPLDSTSDTITTEAFTATIDNGDVLNFPAQTLAGLTASTTYLVLWNLDTSAFEAVPAPALEQVASDRYVIVREMTTANADGTYPTSPTAPGGDGGGGYGGGGCPVTTARILLANADRTGPGETIAAGDLEAGAWVWAQMEAEAGTDKFGAYLVTFARTFESDLFSVDGRPLTSPSHLWFEGDGWSRADAIGKPAGRGRVVALTVAQAHTYVIVADDGTWHLSHNKLASQPELA